jgi:rhodanese-related sulfurtransferase
MQLDGAIVEFVQKNIWLVIAAVVSGALFVWPSVARLFSRTREVGVAEAVQLINRKDAAIIDVREPAEFKAGHIPNARNIPAGQIKERTKELGKFKSKPLLLVCQTGNRSAQVCGSLQKDGIGEPVALSGGMAAWQQAGMPVEKDG